MEGSLALSVRNGGKDRSLLPRQAIGWLGRDKNDFIRLLRLGFTCNVHE